MGKFLCIICLTTPFLLTGCASDQPSRLAAGTEPASRRPGERNRNEPAPTPESISDGQTTLYNVLSAFFWPLTGLYHIVFGDPIGC